MNFNLGLSDAISRGSLAPNQRRQRTGARPASVAFGRKLAPLIKPAAMIEHPGIARSVQYMAKHSRNPIRVTDLMAVAKLSRRGFLKSFRKHTGRTPGAVLRRLRIELAKRLLVEHDFSLDVVALASGFRKTNSFSVAFRSVTGLSPMEFRRRAEPGIESHSRYRNTGRDRRSCRCA